MSKLVINSNGKAVKKKRIIFKARQQGLTTMYKALGFIYV